MLSDVRLGEDVELGLAKWRNGGMAGGMSYPGKLPRTSFINQYKPQKSTEYIENGFATFLDMDFADRDMAILCSFLSFLFGLNFQTWPLQPTLVVAPQLCISGTKSTVPLSQSILYPLDG